MSTVTRVRRTLFVLLIASTINLVVTAAQLISPALWRRRTPPEPPSPPGPPAAGEPREPA
jgi:hypothetical protein